MCVVKYVAAVLCICVCSSGGGRMLSVGPFLSAALMRRAGCGLARNDAAWQGVLRHQEGVMPWLAGH